MLTPDAWSSSNSEADLPKSRRLLRGESDGDRHLPGSSLYSWGPRVRRFPRALSQRQGSDPVTGARWKTRGSAVTRHWQALSVRQRSRQAEVSEAPVSANQVIAVTRSPSSVTIKP
jgi:hypothetical protein